jgi:hypothetical protein
MDLLGHIGEESRDKEHQDRESYLEDEGWHAPTMLLGRLSSPLIRMLS